MSSGETNDEELYERWFSPGPSAERQTAWEELDRRYRRKLLACCYRITNDPVTAEECVHDAFFALMHRHRSIGKSFRAYLWTTARNLARRALKHRPGEPAPVETQGGDDPLSELIAHEERRALEHCRDQLPPEEQDFLDSHVCDELTLEEAAYVVGWDLTIPGCKYRYDRALEKLRSCLKSLGFSS